MKSRLPPAWAIGPWLHFVSTRADFIAQHFPAMIIKPKVRGFICITSHPEGCAENVATQIAHVVKKGSLTGMPKRVLVVGSSTGYGLASRITAAFGGDAATLGVFFEKPAEEGRTGSAGWYNSAAFEEAARLRGLYAKSINGDAFSDAIKQQAIDLIKADLGQVDAVIYSLASPRRTHPKSGETFKSVLKPIGAPYTAKTVDTDKGIVSDITIEPASDQEIADTTAVMGGEDWEMWIDALSAAGVLADGATTVAYSYIGPTVTWAIYRNGTIGRAKEDLEAAVGRITGKISAKGGRAFVSINKALVTQASSAIPVVPLYISLLYKVMKAKGLHEGCIEQIQRLFAERLFNGASPQLDAEGRIRIDDWEMRADVQAEVEKVWPTVTTDSLFELTDMAGYRQEFLRLFGFGLPGIDYEAETNPLVPVSFGG
jgi:enoyl-[acyl-carrier protein] reductase/trans-2-enoyl-CoA reductase (NAD+)